MCSLVRLAGSAWKLSILQHVLFSGYLVSCFVVGKCTKFLLSFHVFFPLHYCNWFRFCVISSTCWSWFKGEPSSRCLVGSCRSKFLIWTNLRIPTFRGSFFKRRALPWNEMHLEAFIEDGLQNFKCQMSSLQGEREEGFDHGPSSTSESNSIPIHPKSLTDCDKTWQDNKSGSLEVRCWISSNWWARVLWFSCESYPGCHTQNKHEE